MQSSTIETFGFGTPRRKMRSSQPDSVLDCVTEKLRKLHIITLPNFLERNHFVDHYIIKSYYKAKRQKRIVTITLAWLGRGVFVMLCVYMLLYTTHSG